jgi:carbonic anhydrase/acetyltransferase-like protein (isoleucine patch superfamily)
MKTIEIGTRSNIQDGAMRMPTRAFPLRVGEDVTIGHHAILHGFQIGAGALVGMGATILNGARIGAGCLVGARALVTEGKEFPHHSLIVGSPANAIRLLDEATVDGLRVSARAYVANWRRFRDPLKRID